MPSGKTQRKVYMTHYYWSDWYSGWGWMLWFGMIFLVFSSFGNWGYTYQAHRRYREIAPGKEAMDILAKRYAAGEIKREEFFKMKDEILSAVKIHAEKRLLKPGSFSSPQSSNF